MKIKTSELIGPALDWAVAKALQQQRNLPSGYWTGAVLRGNFAPATCWSNGGPIIEQEGIGLFFDRACGNRWRATHRFAPYHLHESALVAAMRCFATSRLGDEVDVPDDLLEHP